MVRTTTAYLVLVVGLGCAVLGCSPSVDSVQLAGATVIDDAGIVLRPSVPLTRTRTRADLHIEVDEAWDPVPPFTGGYRDKNGEVVVLRVVLVGNSGGEYSARVYGTSSGSGGRWLSIRFDPRVLGSEPITALRLHGNRPITAQRIVWDNWDPK
jgi:hypothetical protein